MGYAELIERLQALPLEKQAEVFDFVDFLTVRTLGLVESSRQDWNDHEFEEMAMVQALGGMEDESVVYNLDDLRERWV